MKEYTGVVISVQFSCGGPPGERWLITMDTERMVPRTRPHKNEPRNRAHGILETRGSASGVHLAQLKHRFSSIVLHGQPAEIRPAAAPDKRRACQGLDFALSHSYFCQDAAWSKIIMSRSRLHSRQSHPGAGRSAID
jgi:hypothetical protein